MTIKEKKLPVDGWDFSKYVPDYLTTTFRFADQINSYEEICTLGYGGTTRAELINFVFPVSNDIDVPVYYAVKGRHQNLKQALFCNGFIGKDSPCIKGMLTLGLDTKLIDNLYFQLTQTNDDQFSHVRAYFENDQPRISSDRLQVHRPRLKAAVKKVFSQVSSLLLKDHIGVYIIYQEGSGDYFYSYLPRTHQLCFRSQVGDHIDRE